MKALYLYNKSQSILSLGVETPETTCALTLKPSQGVDLLTIYPDPVFWKTYHWFQRWRTMLTLTEIH
jgi:hypothetical protein